MAGHDLCKLNAKITTETPNPLANLASSLLATQCLAIGIVIVFLVGLVKNWATNRRMRKHEELDAEKQARVAELRKSGLAASSTSTVTDIPFGAKALESGVEVDGVWVARMASLASRPPDRKWSSQRRKPRAPMNSSAAVAGGVTVEMSDLGRGGSSAETRRVGSRGSRRAGKISRREIVEPSSQTRGKLENLALLEEETLDEGGGRLKEPPKGALGRIQRNLKRMTPENPHDQDRKGGHNQHGDGRLDAQEFHQKAEAKKPQRFYPTSPVTTTPTMLLVAPQATSQMDRHRVHSHLDAHGLSTTEDRPAGEKHRATRRSLSNNSRQSFSARQQAAAAAASHPYDPRPQHVHQNSVVSPASSADSFVTTVEAPNESPAQTRHSAPAPQQQTHVSTESKRLSLERPEVGPRRSSLKSNHSTKQRNKLRRKSADGRRSIEQRRGSIEHRNVEVPTPPVAQAPGTHHYPPNSSRAAAAAPRRRSQSSSRYEQQQQGGFMPPSPSLGSGDM